MCVAEMELHSVFVTQPARLHTPQPGHRHCVSTGFQQINVIKVYMLTEANRMGLFHSKDQKKIVTNVVENYFDIAFSVQHHN